MGAPQLQYAIPAGGGVPVGVSGVGTVNRLTKWSAATTIADSGVSDDGTTVSFVARNLSSSAAQTWTLATSTTALNIQSGLLNLDTTNSRVGIGTTSPAAPLHVGSGTAGVVATPKVLISYADTGQHSLVFKNNNVEGYHLINASEYVFGTYTSTPVLLRTSNTTRVTILPGGDVGVGTASPTGALHVVGGTAASGNGTSITLAAQSGFGTGVTNGGNIVLTPGAQNSTGTVGLVDLSGRTGTGLKLPSTPGNGDAQALDCYAEGTWTPTLAGFVTTTPSSVTASYTRVGRMVTLNVYLYAGGSLFGSVLGTTTVTVPSGMTPNFSGVGHGGLSRTTSSVAQVVAYYDGKIYLGTSAASASEMWVSVTYYV